ncbi:3-methyl-2-oxobutanoate hydroxymethyltransferase [Candidatus Tachikawaea gelatinosa]|uniref:3-methyl-2-oxobutanoate hydroxymethyltransferase n=1 Tax=Candidatus Tachikawaea gelatinosa TaxID=1410383 RepID=A0A090AJJ6_9ENTR|nr:3-methyl-2-oxobutanoate hydroxymethyltransferase [Candidatus Tachikawaea gelatinosa]BAP58618.1 3-methyl-2-oxobutanoate hydroxymethyltransferase [Candidatus Tachikawaea gelatinosa]
MDNITISKIYQWKKEKIKFAALTVYDFSFARLFFEEGIQVMLVGDSLGITIQGHNSTIPVTVKDIVYHVRGVRKGAPNSLIIADLPFMSYTCPKKAFKNSKKIIQAGANIIKIEGGHWLKDIVSLLTERSIPVCGHIGLTPQSINLFGKYKVQGRAQEQFHQILSDAIILEKSGLKMIVVECITSELAKQMTKELKIPIIGIGSGNKTDGQILVMHDALGITSGNIPKFVKNFLIKNNNIRSAIRAYVYEVKNSIFPSLEHTFL